MDVIMPDRKLLRVFVAPEGICNYDCLYCMNEKSNTEIMWDLSRHECDVLLACVKMSGCTELMLTGGEPFLCPVPALQNLISAVCGIEGFKPPRITTNASLVTAENITALIDAGLQRISVSLHGYDTETYEAITSASRVHFSFDALLGNIRLLANMGLDVKTDLCLYNVNNTFDAEKLLPLLMCLEDCGVAEFGYNRMHNVPRIEAHFDSVYIDEASIQDLFSKWIRHGRDGELGAFFRNPNGRLKVIIPYSPVKPELNQRCLSNQCETRCQGNYSSYVVRTREGERDGLTFRACNRVFDDKRNEYFVPIAWIRENKLDHVTEVINTVWRYTR